MKIRFLKTRYQCVKQCGFTLVEMIVTLAMASILLGIAGSGLAVWIRYSNYIHCEEAAKTTFLAMQNALADLDAQGELESEFARLEEMDIDYVSDRVNPGAVLYPDMENRIAYIGVNGTDFAAYENGISDELTTWLYDLLTTELSDRNMLSSSGGILYPSSANLIVELDMKSHTVYSVFYASWAESLSYFKSENTNNPHSKVSVNAYGSFEISREPSNRRPLCLGYYSTEDIAHVKQLNAKRLKINGLRLVNEETLYVKFGSNVSEKDWNAVAYSIDLYNADGGFICHLLLSSASLNDDGVETITKIPVSFDESQAGTRESGSTQFYFPVSMLDGQYCVTLDAMLDGPALGVLNAKLGGGDSFQTVEEAGSYTYSIRRLLDRAECSAEEQPDIQVTVKAFPDTRIGSAQEYAESAERTSNTVNCLFQSVSDTGDGKSKVKLSKFRHLYNIRYYQDRTENKRVTFTLNNSLDWTLAPGPLYGYAQRASSAQKTVAMDQEQALFPIPYLLTKQTERYPQNKEGSSAAKRDTSRHFPSIPRLKGGYTLEGSSKNITISGLTLGEQSSVSYQKDREGNLNLTSNQAEDLALILENQGTIRKLTLNGIRVNANVSQNGKALVTTSRNSKQEGITVSLSSASNMPRLQRAAVLCAQNSGTIEEILISNSTIDAASVWDSSASASGIAMVAAVMKQGGEISSVSTLNQEDNHSVSYVHGTIAAGKQEFASSLEQASIDAGIGGIAGFVNASTGRTAIGASGKVRNDADVTGNTQTGGIAGAIRTAEGSNAVAEQIKNCENRGLVLCTADTSEYADGAYLCYGLFTGGVIGYADHTIIGNCTSDAGSKEGYSKAGAKELLFQTDDDGNYIGGDCKGNYVGGIVGYSEGGRLEQCKTTAKGYVLGYDYVGGIAGGMSGNGRKFHSETTQTVNTCHVVGHSYVGGIVGRNGAGSTIADCINRGLVGGYGRNIGGITGENLGTGTDSAQLAKVENCTSDVNDNSGTFYHMATAFWEVDGDNVGGLVGYNQNGWIAFQALSSNPLSIKEISSVVVGNNNVGGVIGLNGPTGDFALDTNDSRVVGGRIKGRGNGVGGLIGTNLSEKVFYRNRIENGELIYEDSDTAESYQIQPSGVTGLECVGGVIGANLVGGDAEMKISTSNAYASVTGTNIVGGIIGYAQTLSSDQKEKALSGILAGEPSIKRLDSGKYAQSYASEGRFHISSVENTLSVRGGIYVGGIVGMSGESSYIEICSAENRGAVSGSGESYMALDRFFGTAWNTLMQLDSELENDEAVNSVSAIGGIIGYNNRYTTLDRCISSGSITAAEGCSVMGGVVGINEGLVTDCTLARTLENSEQSFVGGIVGINNHVGIVLSYQGKQYQSGTVKSSLVIDGNFAIRGRGFVGGIAALNGPQALISGCHNAASVAASGSNIGGLVGENFGMLHVENTVDCESVLGADYVGGLVGSNRSGLVTFLDNVDATGSSLSVRGSRYVGGIVGMQIGGSLAGSETKRLTNCATVTATEGYAGGIVGGLKDEAIDLSHVKNWGNITAASGIAGGIVSNTLPGCHIAYADNCADVSADRAGGIVSINENNSTIAYCSVRAEKQNSNLTITSSTGRYMGSLASENRGTIVSCGVGTAGDDMAEYPVLVKGVGTTIGGLAGKNDGNIRYCTVTPSFLLDTEEISSAKSSYLLGGIVGSNTGTISQCTVTKYFDGKSQIKPVVEENMVTPDAEQSFWMMSSCTVSGTGFTNVQYLGGIAGENRQVISGCAFSGSIHEHRGKAGNAYGGIVGKNRSIVTDCSVSQLTMKGDGTATLVNTADRSVMMGGIVGRNQGEESWISDCELGNGVVIDFTNGLCAGIAAHNSGTIARCGAMTGTTDWKILKENEKTDYLNWGRYDDEENPGKSVLNRLTDETDLHSGTVHLSLTASGYLGGIAAQTSSTASVSDCITGENWTIYNNGKDMSTAASGGVAKNESKRISYLINCARIYQNSIAGGVICRQEVQNSNAWNVEHCFNFGMVYGNGDCSGGIIGEIRFVGGTIDSCHNYGEVTAADGAAGGIVASDNKLQRNTLLTMSNCTNHGVVQANQIAAGIYGIGMQEDGASQRIFYHCANYGEITATGDSSAEQIATGIGGNFSRDVLGQTVKSNGTLLFHYCQNYGKLNGAKTYAVTQSEAENTDISYSLQIEKDPIAFISPAIAVGGLGTGHCYALDSASKEPNATAPNGHDTPDDGEDIVSNHLINDNEKDSKYLAQIDGPVGADLDVIYAKGVEEVLDSKWESTKFYRSFIAQLSKVITRLLVPKEIAVSEPENTDYTVTWSAVENAVGYEVEVYQFDSKDEADGADLSTLQPVTVQTIHNGRATFLTIALPELENVYLVARVRALAYDSRYHSEWSAASEPRHVAIPLTQPRVMLAQMTQSESRCFQVRLTERCMQAYRQYDADGVGFEITVDYGGQTAKIDNTNYTKWIEFAAIGDGSGGETGVLSATAEVTQGTGYIHSPTTNTVTSLFDFSDDRMAMDDGSLQTAAMTGTTADNLAISTKLVAKSTEDFPIYRVELVKVNASDGAEHVIDHKDVMLTKSGTTVTFYHLTDVAPDLLEDCGELYLRAWLAESGKGKVYYYDPTARPDEGGSMISTSAAATAAAKMSTVEIPYLYSQETCPYVEKNYRSKPVDRSMQLRAPILMDNTEVLPETDNERGLLQYTFAWDTEEIVGETYRPEDYADAVYNVTVFQGDSSIVLETRNNVSYAEASKPFDADRWDCNEVTVRLERCGIAASDGSTQALGSSAEKIYRVRKHLQRIARPAVELLNRNDLYYSIRWSSRPKDGDHCKEYAVYIAGREQPLGVVAHEDGKTAYTLNRIDLEPYAGRNLSISVVAIPTDGNPSYVSSLAGIAAEISVPTRTDLPPYQLLWDESVWQLMDDGEESIVSEEEYSDGALKLCAEVVENGQRNGSYVLDGTICERDAESTMQFLKTMCEIDPIEGNHYIQSIVDENIVLPQSMKTLGNGAPILMVSDESSSLYSAELNGLSLDSAGKELVLAMRKMPNTGISSLWSIAEATMKLPRVKLMQPSMTTSLVFTDETSVWGYVGDWEAVATAVTQKAIEWDGRKQADSYQLVLQASDTGISESHTYHISGGVDASDVLWVQVMEEEEQIVSQSAALSPLKLNDGESKEVLSMDISTLAAWPNGMMMIGGEEREFFFELTGCLKIVVTKNGEDYAIKYQVVLPELGGELSVSLIDENGLQAPQPVMECVTEEYQTAELTAEVLPDGSRNSEQFVSSDAVSVALE